MADKENKKIEEKNWMMSMAEDYSLHILKKIIIKPVLKL